MRGGRGGANRLCGQAGRSVPVHKSAVTRRDGGNRPAVSHRSATGRDYQGHRRPGSAQTHRLRAADSVVTHGKGCGFRADSSRRKRHTDRAGAVRRDRGCSAVVGALGKVAGIRAVQGKAVQGQKGTAGVGKCDSLRGACGAQSLVIKTYAGGRWGHYGCLEEDGNGVAIICHRQIHPSIPVEVTDRKVYGN